MICLFLIFMTDLYTRTVRNAVDVKWLSAQPCQTSGNGPQVADGSA